MLLRRNKTSGKTAKSESIAWHPNFRDPSRLPDTKTVRTKFFVNAVAVTIALGLTLSTVNREITLASARSDLASLELRIADSAPANTKALADFKRYQDEEKQFNTATASFKSSFSYPDLLVTLATLLPNGVKISRAEYRGVGQNINIAGSVRGLDTNASDLASSFVKSLQENQYFKKNFASIALTGISRDAAEGNMIFEIALSFPAAPAPTPPKPGASK